MAGSGASRRLVLLEVVRRGVQLGLFVLFSAGLWGLAATPLLLPILIPSSTPGRVVGNAFSVMEHMLSEGLAPLLPLAAFIIICSLFGRALCGWACPFGLVQDILRHAKRRPFEVAAHTHRSAVKLKYYVLGACLLVSGTLAISLAAGVGEDYKKALGYFALGPFTVLSPAETLFSLLPGLLVELVEQKPDPRAFMSNLPWFFWARLLVMVSVLVLVAYVPRGWCRYLCPVGALSAVFSRFSLLGLRINTVRCDRCGACVRTCPMMVRLLEQSPEKISDPECIYCLRCVAACPHGAIRPRFP